jgi:hypothetical protein
LFFAGKSAAAAGAEKAPQDCMQNALDRGVSLPELTRLGRAEAGPADNRASPCVFASPKRNCRHKAGSQAVKNPGI